MLSREQLRRQIQRHLQGLLTLEDLAGWAEEAFRGETFEVAHAEAIEEVLALLRDATDPHRFRWEEPDFETMLERLTDP